MGLKSNCAKSLNMLYLCSGTMTPNISISSLTTTSVSLSWTQPVFSVPVQYVVSVTPLSGSSQMLCVVDNMTIESTPIGSSAADYATMSVTGLQEFIAYTATVIVRQGGFQLDSLSLGSTQFTTLRTGMYTVLGKIHHC